jgi:hypothetical protein
MILKDYFMTRNGLVSVILIVAAVTIFAACADDGSGEQSDSPSATAAADAAAPTFVRVTVTPIPTATPTPEPTAVAKLTAEQLADPVFPDWLEPNAQGESLTDEEIIDGWSEYLSDTSGFLEVLNRPNFTRHLCAGGQIYRNNNLDTRAQDWEVVVNRSLSSNSYTGIEVTGNRSELIRTKIYTLSRQNGIIYNNGTPVEIKRSTLCLDHHL